MLLHSRQKSSIYSRNQEEIKTFGRADIHFQPLFSAELSSSHLTAAFCSWAVWLELFGDVCFAKGISAASQGSKTRLGPLRFHQQVQGFEKQVISFYSTSYHTIPYCPCNTHTDKRLHYVGHRSFRQHSCVCSLNRTITREMQCVFWLIVRGRLWLVLRHLPISSLMKHGREANILHSSSPLKLSALYIVAHC